MELQGEEVPGAESYDQPGLQLQIPDLPVVIPDNAQEQLEQGSGWEYPDFEDPCSGA